MSLGWEVGILSLSDDILQTTDRSAASGYNLLVFHFSRICRGTLLVHSTLAKAVITRVPRCRLIDEGMDGRETERNRSIEI